MKLLLQIGIVLGVCLAGEGISAALHAPVAGTISRVTDTEIEMTTGEVK